ncbi:MAG: class I SAM-dependent methyltransferase [Parachlamydiales bacterium]|nr:class I SAM-dependent methyltransferase [Parachlamydiales bacterium]
MKIKEWIRVYFSLQWHHVKEAVHTFVHYHRHPKFRKMNWKLKTAYLTQSPYKVSKEFLVKKGDSDIFTYGHTPLSTLHKIAKETSLNNTDNVLDLGCGIGQTTMWLNTFFGCNATGVDHNPIFISRANRIVKKNHELKFSCKDLLDTDYSKSTWVYLYGSCFEDEFVQRLTKKMESLPSGAQVVTVSYPITDYSNNFKLEKVFPSAYPWGIAEVFVQRRL